MGQKQSFRPLKGKFPLLSDKQNFTGLDIQWSFVLSSAMSGSFNPQTKGPHGSGPVKV
jgi:hypothetical protein